MDEFDTKLKNAQAPIEPREDFVEKTMEQIQATTPAARKKWGMKIWIPSAAVGTVLVVAAILFLPLLHGSQSVANSTKVATKTATTSKTPSQPSPNSPTITSSDGTDDASLQSDLNGINSSMNQENGDQSTANSNLNDSSQEITVPSS